MLCGLRLLLATVVVSPEQGHAAPVLSFAQRHDGDTLTYNGTGSVLKGTNLRCERLIGGETTVNNGVALSYNHCVLNFGTGFNVSDTSPHEWKETVCP